MIFAYSSDTSLNNIVKRIGELNTNIDVGNRLSIVCILDKGLIFGVNKHGFKEIEIKEKERIDNFITILFEKYKEKKSH